MKGLFYVPAIAAAGYLVGDGVLKQQGGAGDFVFSYQGRYFLNVWLMLPRRSAEV